ncbi:DUF1766-domain-containing protein [Microthyrium microscopicum]|uniref:DUF1766-domain-containing protein n=1 Tax=Microthyrium microscopicum TaxID=703497 RepID=A0A6A6UCK1_9PEZI|nr:DUF1766-domain-containing protein [Microthyrium microscopicum]
MSSPSSSRPSFGRTPESSYSGLRRKDSKQALLTCHGTTDKGRACRRSLAAKDSVPSARYTIKGTILIPHKDQDPAVFFCWQHKEQANILKRESKSSEVDSIDIEERASLETVFRNLGLEEVEEEADDDVSVLDTPQPSRQPPAVRRRPVGSPRYDSFSERLARPPAVRVAGRHRDQREFSSGSPINLTKVSLSPPSPQQRRPRLQKKESIFSGLFACFSGSGSSTSPPRVRERRRSSQNTSRSPRRSPKPMISTVAPEDRFLVPTAGNAPLPATPTAKSRRQSNIDRPDSGVALSSNPCRQYPTSLSHLPAPQSKQRRKSDTLHVYRDINPTPYQHPHLTHSDSRQPLPTRKPLAPRSKSSPENRPSNLANWTPALPPNATDTVRLAYAKLLTSMSEPPTKHDDEGYIYMFWQTPFAVTRAESDAAASIISAASLSRSSGDQEDVLRRRFFQTSSNARLPPRERRTISLKIGRAANVHQRMAQWTKQCGYPITLLRYYPQGEEAKVVYVGKVERLVHLHLEMLGMRVSKECGCGTEHREWFEIEGTTGAVREVDSIIGQWVEWCSWKYGGI